MILGIFSVSHAQIVRIKIASILHTCQKTVIEIVQINKINEIECNSKYFKIILKSVIKCTRIISIKNTSNLMALLLFFDRVPQYHIWMEE